MVNEITLIGNLGADPEVKQLGDSALSNLSLATTRSYKKDDEWKEETQWHRVSLWREFKAKKGDLVYIKGRVEYREHEGKWYTTIRADYARNLTPRSEGSVSTQSSQAAESGSLIEPRDDENLPF